MRERQQANGGERGEGEGGTGERGGGGGSEVERDI